MIGAPVVFRLLFEERGLQAEPPPELVAPLHAGSGSVRGGHAQTTASLPPACKLTAPKTKDLLKPPYAVIWGNRVSWSHYYISFWLDLGSIF